MKLQAIKRFTPVAALIVAMALAGCVSEPPRDPGNIVNSGDAVPSFTVTNADGVGTRTFSQADFAGKRSVIAFFWTPCGDCRREMPKVEAAWQALKDEPDFQLIAISRGETPDVVAAHWAEVGYTMPYLLDPNADAFHLFAENTVPRIYLVDSGGIIQYVGIETFEFGSGAELVNLINGLR
jgi:peroxiredoxin